MPSFAISKFTVLLEPLWVSAEFLLLSTGSLSYLIEQNFAVYDPAPALSPAFLSSPPCALIEARQRPKPAPKPLPPIPYLALYKATHRLTGANGRDTASTIFCVTC